MESKYLQEINKALAKNIKTEKNISTSSGKCWLRLRSRLPWMSSWL